MAIKNLAKLYSAEIDGIHAQLIEAEIDINVGLHSFTIVGLADKALNEAKERVNSAIKNCGMRPPNRENRRITVNLAPADMKKTGSHYDLAIALGYLRSTRQIAAFDARRTIFVGELALDGRLRSVSGALNIAEMARMRGFDFLFLPTENAAEASAIEGIAVVPLKDLREAIALLEKGTAPVAYTSKSGSERSPHTSAAVDLSEVIGQENAKRALMIAAAGGHNLLMVGPPGVGKSMLANSMIGILPALSHEEAIETTKIWSAAGLSPGRLMEQRPFRAPHQTSSTIAIIGGGGNPHPGEISLAHRGVLFLDELPEFSRNVLEALREPLESGSIHIARARRATVFPAKFSLIAAMNPCPCGYYGTDEGDCTCAAYERIKYQKRLSGPFLDRIDLQVRVQKIAIKELQEGDERLTTTTSAAREKIERARDVQRERFSRSGKAGRLNTEMTSREARTMANFDASAVEFLRALDGGRHLSPRGYYRTIKVARTIADLEENACVSGEHLAEAFGYRLRLA